jgi:predicted alpha/beta superfamily hydrolase
VPSRVLREVRLVRVLMPAAPTAVLLLNDGQNLFARARTVGTRERWDVERAATAVPHLAIVGIDHARAARARDYLPCANPADPLARRPRGDRYVSFIVDELLGWIARRYPEVARARHLGIGGSSYGAVSALHCALARPGTFDRLLLESPSLYVGGRRLISDARAAEDVPARVHLGVGTAESRDPEVSARVVADVVELTAILRAKGRGPRAVRLVVDEGRAHHERAWASRLPGALRFLFG